MMLMGFRCIIGALTAALLMAVLPGPAYAKWLVARSPAFIVYSDGEAKELKAFVEDLEKYDALLREMTGVRGPRSAPPLSIYVANSSKAFKAINPYAPEALRGYYSAGSRGILAAAKLMPSDGEWVSARMVLFHEYTHHFIAQYFPGVYPRWFNEGFAEYYSTVEFKSDGVEVGQANLSRAYGLVANSWRPIESVVAPALASDRGEEMFYAQSWLATHYLLRSPERMPQLQDYLRALRRGDDPTLAFTTAFQTDFPSFDKALRDYVKRGMSYSKIGWTAPAAGDIAIGPMPASADKMLALRARMLSGAVSEDDREAFISLVRREAAAYPEDALALQTLAAAEIYYGEATLAAAPLARLLALNPDDAEALFLKGMQIVMGAWTSPQQARAEIAKARPLFAKAYRLDPNHYQSLYAYGRTFLAEGGKPSDNTLNVLMRAHDLAPQVDEITFAAGRALLDAGAEAQAKPLLEAVAYEPHPGALAQAALAALHRNTTNPEKTISDYTIVLRADSKNVQALVGRALAYAKAGQLDLARSDFAVVRQATGKNAMGLNNLCWIQATNNVALEDALNDCDAALALEPRSPTILDSRGFVNLRLGRLAQALADYDAALALRSRAPSSLYGRALTKQALGRIEEARADREIAIAIRPTIAGEFEGYGLK